jgi:carbon storage regulator
MLVLRRKAGEAIVLNQVIVIRVLNVEGDRVKLGIDAPPDVIVVREELLNDASAAPPSMLHNHTLNPGPYSG